MHIHNVLDTDEAGLAEVGGEFLAASAFENEHPDTEILADEITVVAANAKED